MKGPRSVHSGDTGRRVRRFRRVLPVARGVVVHRTHRETPWGAAQTCGQRLDSFNASWFGNTRSENARIVPFRANALITTQTLVRRLFGGTVAKESVQERTAISVARLQERR